MFFVLTLLASTVASVDAATASWDRNSEPDVAGYKVSYGTQPGIYTTTIDVGNVTSFEFNPPPGQRYYVVVQAYNVAGKIGEKSAEASLEIPGEAIPAPAPPPPVWMVNTPPPNNPPSLTQPVDQSSPLNSNISWALSAGDPDGTMLSFSASGLPPGLSINSASGVIAGIASVKGTYWVTATVSDGALSVSRWFTWTVVEPVSTGDRAMPDMAFDFGSDGLWLKYADSGWRKLDPANPEEMASGDVDGNGQSDLIADYPGQGVWVWLNDSVWFQINTANSGAIVTADLDGNGKSAVVIDFPGYGIWVWRDGGQWLQLDWRSPRAMEAGDMNGDGRAELVFDFAWSGVWVWSDNQWSQLHVQGVTAMSVGDLDGNGRSDILLDFPGAGIWVWGNNSSWWQLHPMQASLITTADLDGNGQDEAIIDFAGYGIWVWDGSGWSRLHERDPEAITIADLDGNGRSDLVIDFGSIGVWGWMNNGGWTQLHTQSPEGSVAGKYKQR